MHVTAIVPAAGEGRRFPGAEPKQYRSLLGMPVLVRTIQALWAAGVVDRLILVVPAGQEVRCRADILEPFDASVDLLVPGGADRQASVYAGLQAVDGPTDVIVVHDAARPLVSPEAIRAAVAAATAEGAAVVAVRVTDTIKVARADGTVRETPGRESLWAAQTPQAFRATVLREAHARALADGVRSTDDAALVERLPHSVRLVPGSPENLKLTTPADWALAEEILRRRGGSAFPGRAAQPEPH